MSFLKVKDVYKDFGKTHVLRGVNLLVEKGEQVALVGPSGSGKSTLLYLLGGLDRPSRGVIEVEGVELQSYSDAELSRYRNSEVGFIFQFHFLLPSMNSLDNILLPCKIGKKNLKETRSQALKLADALGVTHCLKKFPFELSGGEQQRVNIIRALSLKPKLLLCDEPTGNLDSVNSKKVMELLCELSKHFGITLIVVTHDLNIAQSLARKITIEDGRIIS